MPIKSYLAHPHEGKKDQLIKELSMMPHCEVIPAENKDVVIVVTDTETETEEIRLKEKFEAMASVKLLAMVSGFNTPINN